MAIADLFKRIDVILVNLTPGRSPAVEPDGKTYENKNF